MAANSKRQTMECQCNLQQHSERITPNIIVTFSVYKPIATLT